MPPAHRLVVPREGDPPPETVPRVILAHLPDALIVLNRDRSVIFASDRWCEVAGMDRSEIEGRTWSELLPESTREPVAGFVSTLFESPGLLRRATLTFHDAAGAGRLFDVVGHAFDSDEIGPFVALSGRELPAQLDAAGTLATEGRQQRLLDEGVTGSYRAGSDGRLVECNSIFLTILGFGGFEEAYGTDTYALYTEPAARAESIRLLGTGERVGLREVELRRRNGELVHAIENVAPELNGDGTLAGIRVDLVDITPRVRLAREREELLLREKEARAQAEAAERRAAFLAELGSLLDASLDYRETLSNVARLIVPALADYCLIDESTEGYGSRRVAVAHVDPESELLLHANETNSPDADPARHPVLQVIRTGVPVLVPDTEPDLLEQIAHDADHLEKLRELRIRGYIIVPLVARGRSLGALTLVSSTSERLFGEQDVELAEAVARRSALAIDNARLYGRAQQALRARDEVLAFVSHDLRNPLATILLNASALLDALPEDRLLPAEREQLEWIAHSSEQMNRLIQDLLEVSRVESGRLRLDRKPIDPMDLLWEAVLHLQPLASARGVRLDVEDGPVGLTCWMDRERVIRVLGNLIGNAIKFTPSGGEISVSAEQGEGEIRFAVRDTGIGIQPEDQASVFQGYWQRGSRGGSGLGLTIARGIVEAHGGSIWFTSEPGQGSTFYFSLPTSEPG